MYYVPQHQAPVAHFAPQGWVGDLVARQAPLIGGAVGGLTTELSGHPSLGGLVGGATTMLARDYGELIPFNAGPVMAQPAAYAPQGIFGKIGGGLLGGAIGGAFGNRQLGSAIGGAVGNFLPFQAGPAMAQPAYAPQGFWGDMISNVGGAVGNVVGGNTGNIIRDASSLGQYLPFNAGPVMAQPAYAPQGFWGDMISNVGGAVGNVVGGNTGNIIRDASSLGQYLPFNAGPVMAQPAAYAPQGIFGKIGGGLLGGAIGGAFGNRQLGSAIGGAVGNFLPFEAGPAMAQPAYAPQGFWGDMISNVGGAVGNVVGGNTGNIIRDASSLGQYLPFNAGPVMAQPTAYAPQGIFGSIGGGLLGGAIGKALGNKGLGSAIGGAVGAFLPFQAGPGQPIQYVPVADLQAAATQQTQAANQQIVYH